MAAGEVSAALGKSVEIRGEVRGHEDLIVDGLVEGTISLNDSRLTIGANARVKANVSARDVVILGSLQGEINATGRVELRAGCRVIGDLRAARLSIEENAGYTGKVDLIQGAKPAGVGEKAPGGGTEAAGASGTAPGAASGTTPGTTPGATPGAASGATSGTTPGALFRTSS